MAKNSCVDCNSPESIPKTEVLYSKGEPSPRRLRRHYQLAEPVSGYALYHCDDEYKTGFYLIAPQAANNLVTNPTFYVDLDNWSTFNSNIVRTNDIAFDSGFSLRIAGSGDVITAERREYAETLVTSFLPGQPYTFTMYGWTPVIWDLSDTISLTISIADDLGNEIFSTPIDKAGQWQRLTVTTVIEEAATELYLRVNLRSQDQRENQPPHNLTGEFNLPGEYAFFDMAQFEFGVEATTPFHGDTNTCASCDTTCGGYTWTGVAHKSASTRSDCVRDGGKLVCLSDLGFEVTSHTGHGAPPIRDISFPLNNRPGEFYQKSVADARILTLTGQLCEATLKDLECAIYGLGQHIMPKLGPCSCCGQFLLVYHHEECDHNECDTERDLALCVTYLGGLEGSRTNHYGQIATLQFKAHDPFWFEWPGHKSQGLTFAKVVDTPNVLQINSDGTTRGFPISGLNTYNTVACRPGQNSIAIGGIFDSIDGTDERCEENVAIYDCDGWVDLCFGFPGDGINQLTTDNEGNILVAGSFSSPCNNIAIIYPDGTTGCFGGYPGGEAHAIIAPFWSQVVVGDDNGVYFQNTDGDWVTAPTDGRVTGFTLDDAGNLYVFGDFTTVNGVETGSIAFLNINLDGCPSFNTAQFESLGFTFNGSVNGVDINKDTGTVYIGGSFTEATPLPVDICQVTNGSRVDSRGTDQQLQFRQIAGNAYQIEVYYTNIIARNLAESCINNGTYLRITGQSSVGTNYNFLIGQHNAAVNSTNTVIVGTETYYTIIFDVDIGTTIGNPCEELNTSLINELDQTIEDLVLYTPLDLPGGVGIDDTLSTLSAQCVTVTEQFQGDTITLNYAAELNSTSLSAMADGLDDVVNVVAVHPLTGEVYYGTESGLYVYNGLAFYEFSGQLGGSGNVAIRDLDFCNDGCSMVILYDSVSASIVPDVTEVFYNGDVNPSDFELVIHGPGRVESFMHNGSNNGMRLCTVLECDEIATLDFNSGDYRSNFRSNLAPSILGGSRYDTCLSSCDPNNISIYISGDEAQTKATLLWRDAHFGIEALCCKEASSSLQAGGAQASAQALDCNNNEYLEMHRDPTCEDATEQGIAAGTLWFNKASGCGLYLSTGECDCDEFEGAYVGEDGAALTDPEGELLCNDIEIDCDTGL